MTLGSTLTFSLQPPRSRHPITSIRDTELPCPLLHHSIMIPLLSSSIALLLLLIWRTLGDTLLVIAPLLLAALLTGAAAVLLGIPFNFADIIVLPLLLGIGIDSGIHLVNRHRRGDGAILLETTTARAVLFSALTTAGSFATLALSNHLGISSLAQLLSAGVLLMLAANVVVLPAILTWMDS